MILVDDSRKQKNPRIMMFGEVRGYNLHSALQTTKRDRKQSGLSNAGLQQEAIRKVGLCSDMFTFVCWVDLSEKTNVSMSLNKQDKVKNGS